MDRRTRPLSSCDDSWRADRSLRTIQFTRNFGHQAALTAGLAAAQGDVVITMDGDGQHPPELIPQLLEASFSRATTWSRPNAWMLRRREPSRSGPPAASTSFSI